MQKKRLFIAINLPIEIKDIIQSVQNKVDKKSYRLTSLNNLHITLLFLDCLKDDEILKVQNILKKTVPLFPSFITYLSDIIYFSSIKNPRIISITAKSEESLEKLQKILQNKLSRLNFINLEKRKFKPHITIARLKDKGDGAIDFGKMKNIKISRKKWKVGKVTFMESILQPRGAKHIALREFKLKQDK